MLVDELKARMCPLVVPAQDLDPEAIAAALEPVLARIREASSDGQATGIAMQQLRGSPVSGKEVAAAVKSCVGEIRFSAAPSCVWMALETHVARRQAWIPASAPKLYGFVVRRVTQVALLDSLASSSSTRDRSQALARPQRRRREPLLDHLSHPPPTTAASPTSSSTRSWRAARSTRREGFFELVKRSLGTFINAMTADEHTLYPASSSVPKDLFNLADVYWDAVFHPLLTEHTFQREGHRWSSPPEQTLRAIWWSRASSTARCRASIPARRS